MKNSKKQRKGFTAVLAAVGITLLGVGTCFAYPYIETVYSPKTQVLTALKESGAVSGETVSNIFKEVTNVCTGQTQTDGSVTFTQAKFDESDILEEHDFQKGTFKLHIDAKQRNAKGSITAEGSQKKKEAYLSVSEDDLKSFLTENGYAELYEKIHTVTDSVDSDTLKEYMQVSEKIATHIYAGMADTLQQSLYEKDTKSILEINNHEISVVKYKITVTKEALLTGVQKALEYIYTDKELNSYITMFATFTGYSRYDLEQHLEQKFDEFTGADIFVYLDKEKKAVRAETAFDTGFCSVVMEMQGIDNLNEYEAVKVKSERSELEAVCKNTGEKHLADLYIRYHESDSIPYGKIFLELERQGRSISCTKGEIEAMTGNHSAELKFYGVFEYETE